MKAIVECLPKEKRQPWGTETLLAETPEYTLKKLHYLAGFAGGFQYHIKKTESFHLHRGRALVRYHKADGEFGEVLMIPGMTFHIPQGAPHQFEAITDCIVFEASTPAENDRVNVAERYGRPVEPGTLPTTYTEEQIGEFERHEAYKKAWWVTPNEKREAERA